MKKDSRTTLPSVARHPSFHAPSDPLLRKRSVSVALGVLGVAAIGFISFGGKDVQRNGYGSLEDCEHDYATGQCTRDAPVSSSGAGGYHYYGPWYRSDWRSGPIAGDPGPGRRFATGAGVTGHGPSTMDFGRRGGFGSSGRVSARGG
ncbi:hypothetical protein ACQKIE_09035 [Luteibacter sp. NPDC031894]|jgi:hypothetical protein|uniref:hypothetical protein n=1 Tax=Luteibacter sp. NPDC031894 TaxID=3390572 RepID=UPI003D07E6A5